MQLIFLANTQIDWAALTESGLTAMVVTAVFVIIVKPMVSQMLKTNEKSTEALVKLTETIASGDSLIQANTRESEARVLTAFNSLVEPLTIVKENLREQKSQLDRIEEKLNSK